MRTPNFLLISPKLGFATLAIFSLTNCGGTFTLKPDGSLSYTTKEILKAPIVEVAK